MNTGPTVARDVTAAAKWLRSLPDEYLVDANRTLGTLLELVDRLVERTDEQNSLLLAAITANCPNCGTPPASKRGRESVPAQR
jgi:hypothetical protein